MARPEGWSGLFATAFAHSRNPMALVDGERVYVDVNGAHAKLMGYRREALVGRHLYDFEQSSTTVRNQSGGAERRVTRFG